MNIVIAGVQGSGKGTQATKIATEYGLTHISPGDVLRKHIADRTPLGIEYKTEYDAGKLASDKIILEIIALEIENANSNGFILDGFPRTIAQAEWLNDNYDIDLTILLECDHDIVVDRMMYRMRSDDTPDGIKQRIKTYCDVTEPAIRELPHRFSVMADQPEDAVYDDIRDRIELIKLVMRLSSWVSTQSSSIQFILTPQILEVVAFYAIILNLR
jgi:adenylate kinase